MEYSFDEIHDRLGTNSLKWDLKPDCLPMWVADMDFQTAPAVQRAVNARAAQGIYGYNIIPDVWYDAVSDWWARRHKFRFEKEWLIFCTGVVPAVTCSVKRLTNHGDNVVVQTPAYNIFYSSIENTGRHVLENPLQCVNGIYEMNFDDLEKKLAHPNTTMMILCNPQNPSGRIWKKEELERVGELCEKYHVLVLSDEIHCDLTDPGLAYTPFASVSEVCRNNSITCLSATKAFNMAGLQAAAVAVPDERVRNILYRGLNSDELAEPNCFAVPATVAALTEGEEWLDALRIYIKENKDLVYETIESQHLPVRVMHADATYLLWIDCSDISQDTGKLCAYLRKKEKLFLSDGEEYRGDGARYVRMNVACPRQTVQEGLQRFVRGIRSWIEEKM